MNKTRVFVYGTLLSGYGNNRLLEGQTLVGEAATVPEFTLVSCGGYPGLIEGGETSIQGEVYEVTDECLARLDRLEGRRPDNNPNGLYSRLTVQLENGEEAIAYRYNHYRPSQKVISSGSWREWTKQGKGRSYCG